VRDGESLSGAIHFNDYFGLVIILGNMPSSKDSGRNGDEEESVDGVTRRDA
jgi:hypothetical protein